MGLFEINNSSRMFESKLNIYTIQKAAERKIFCLFTWKIGEIKG